MNIRHYILRLLLVFVCLFALFSHSLTVYATDELMPDSLFYMYDNSGISTMSLDEESVTNGEINIWYAISDSSWNVIGGTSPFVVSNSLSSSHSCNISNLTGSSYYDSLRMSNIDGSSLFSEGDKFTLNVTNLLDYLEVKNSNGNITTYNLSNISAITSVKVRVDDINKKAYYIDASDYLFTQNGNTISLEATFENMPFDVYNMSVFFSTNISSAYNIPSSYFNNSSYTITRHFGFSNSTFSFKTEDKTQGLLSSIIELIKSIITGITELPTKIKNALSSLFNMIVNALKDLGNFIIDGIKNLFIPSEEDITNMKDKWDILLSDRFGALYQVGTLISDYAAAFTEQSKGTITFPSITIPLAGAEFTFGGWEVQVVPDGFGVVFDTLKIITSILATLLFANGLKKRFDKLLGGADDI